MKSFFNKSTKTLLCSVMIVSCIVGILANNIDIKSELLKENKLIQKDITGSQMHSYELQIPETWMNKDLIVETNLVKENNLISSPLVILSLDPLGNDSKEKQWVCNQLGGETCFLPAKYLQPGKTVYVGVFCKNCSYNLKYLFAKETSLKLGETTMFHLKAGDSKVFDITLRETADFKDFVNISAFNLRMTKFSMKVQIENNKDIKADPIEALVSSNWKGGQQALIYPKNFILDNTSENKNLMNYSFKVVIYAYENGVFNIEATSGNTIIALGNSVRFDSINKNAPLCYYYNDTNNNKKIFVDIKSINGDLKIYTQQDKLPQFDDYHQKFSVNNEREEKLNFDTTENVQKWFLCVEGDDTAYYSIHIYNEGVQSQVQNYKNLLYSKKFITFRSFKIQRDVLYS